MNWYHINQEIRVTMRKWMDVLKAANTIEASPAHILQYQ